MGEDEVMIEKVLEAYEEETKEKNSFWRKLKQKDLTSKILLVFSLISFIIILIFFFCFHNYVMFIVMWVYMIVLYLIVISLEKWWHKKWKENNKEYNDQLNIIASILKKSEFNLYSKNKIKQLIAKYYQSIQQVTTIQDKTKNNAKEFYSLYIVPIIAFFGGKVNTTGFNNSEIIAAAIIFVILVTNIKYIIGVFIEIFKMIGWNQLEKEKHFVLKLQDLLDRDFIIEKDDLLTQYN